MHLFLKKIYRKNPFPKIYRINQCEVLNNFIRNETLEKANIKIVNATSKLPMFQYYNIEEDQVHSSSDGQKFGTKFDTINSRYSPKYYGLGKGLSDYTMVANHIPVNAKIIGTHEHESYFVFDLLYNNQTDIQPEIHSTDTDGTNQVNFAILDSLVISLPLDTPPSLPEQK